MKRYLVLALATLALAIAAPSAFATRIIFDPPSLTSPLAAIPPATDCTLGTPPTDNFTPCNISKLDTPYTVAFVDCTTLTGLKNPAPGWCLYLNNVTHGSLSKFTFAFAVPDPANSYDGTNVLTCHSQPPGYASNNCPDGAALTAGESLDLSFFAPLQNNNDFYLITDFVYQPAPATVTVSVPEPGELGLFGLGLLVIGAAVVWEKRRRLVGRNGVA